MGLVRYLLWPWHAHMRSIDLMMLWPACCDRAPDQDVAKAAFMFHCMHDPAWRVLGEAEIIRRVDALKPPSGALGADRSGQVPCNPGPRPDRDIDWDHDEIGGAVVHNPSAQYGPHSVPGREEGGTP